MSLAVNTTSSYHSDAMGVPASRGVMLGWSVEGDGALDQEAGATVVVARDRAALERGDLLWRADGVRSRAVLYAGPPLHSRDRVWWRVEVTTAAGETVTSAPTSVEVGLEHDSDWTAQWISAPLLPHRREAWDPAPLFRREFTLASVPEFARLYATALGVYRIWVNGEEITAHSLLRPGWTDYRFRVLHQTYDVAAALTPGVNVLAIELARGWYAGRLGLQREPALYGEQPALRVQLEAAGDVITATDSTWRYGYGDILASDLLLGEVQDLRQAQNGWTSAGFDDSAWEAALVRDDISVAVTPQPHASPDEFESYEGKLVRAHARGPAVFDFGQNLVGWTRVETRTLPKADVLVRHGETLTPDDLVWRDNLRNAFQEDRYTTGDDRAHVLEPRHTMHGFRFAEVWGLAPAVEYQALKVPEDFRITAISMAGVTPVGTFECSDPVLTAVSRMVEWTVRDNFIEVITDCPQRDERLGWLGDAGVIGPTAAYHFDVASFVTKFTRDAADTQTEDGAILSYVPPVPPGTFREGAPGWADGYVRLVHLAAQRYGDVATAQEHFDHIARYLAWIDEANPSGIRTESVGADFSDWLSLPEDPDEPPHPEYVYTGSRSTSSKRVVATAHTIRSYDQFADLATMLGRDEEAVRARARAEEIRLAYANTFVDERGWIEGDTQTVYAQAIGYDILRGDLRRKAIARLAQKVRELGHVTVGIHGVEHLVRVLARNGHADLAEMLLLREEMPSWKHMHAMGGTTIWEKWDGISSDGSMSTAEMNSFNHCALGAIGEFLFEGVAGLDARRVVGESTVIIDPVYLERLDWARADYASPAGRVESSWRRRGDRIEHDITLAPGIRGEFRTPDGYRLVDGDSELDSGLSRIVVERTMA